MTARTAALLLASLALGCNSSSPEPAGDPPAPSLPNSAHVVPDAPGFPPPPPGALAAAFAGTGTVAREPEPREKRLRNLRQVTFEGENAEAYWSNDGTRLVLQHRGKDVPADQIYTVRADGTDLRLLSTGWGKTTCAYFLPGDKSILYASTHGTSLEPPPPPDMRSGYVWALYAGFDIWAVDLDGTNLRRLTDAPGYDAEGTVSPDGKRIVFTSVRDGELELYTMALDGGDLRRVTNQAGYDGGAFFSPDSKRLCFRANQPKGEEETAKYLALLKDGLIRPRQLELQVCDADGGNRVTVTSNGAANFAPYFHPDGKRLVFSSNMDDPKGREFDIYMVSLDGTGLERITFTPEFDGFPMFSPDGKTLVFCSNRHGAERGSTNVFLADWVE